MSYFAKAVLVAAVVLLPALSHAQSLAGTVRDASGGVLPGVTVEAASPVLIEKVRTATTDDAGQYRIENLPPGTYSLTYTLPGFTTVKRDGVELSGVGVITINSELRVGGIQETITVTGESPVVDTQTSTRRQMVLSRRHDSEPSRPRAATATCWRRCRGFRRRASMSAQVCRRTSSPRAADVAMKARFRSMA